MDIRRDDGIALLVAMMAMLLMSALGAALVLTTSSDARIAANFRDAQEGVYAADSALEHAMDDLGTLADWNAVLDGSAPSTFVDGAPGGVRTLADGSSLDLAQTLNLRNCRKVTACNASNLAANTPQRPWGANNPVWRLFAYGPMSNLLPLRALESAFYVIVMVADDPSENDNDPLHDGQSATNPGTGVIALRAEAFGPRGTRQVVELTVARTGMEAAGLRVLSWRLTR
jgi:hypothetical protein